MVGGEGGATAYTTLGFENSFSSITVWLFIVGLGFGSIRFGLVNFKLLKPKPKPKPN